tara:strand:+ start:906 stop:1145 length:240 start_codon:yes stop_codon:yes gene_type:complete
MSDHVPLKPTITFQATDDVSITASCILTGPDGKFVNFSLDREMAYGMAIELVYHLRRQEELIANAPVQAPPGYVAGKNP